MFHEVVIICYNDRMEQLRQNAGISLTLTFLLFLLTTLACNAPLGGAKATTAPPPTSTNESTSIPPTVTIEAQAETPTVEAIATATIDISDIEGLPTVTPVLDPATPTREVPPTFTPIRIKATRTPSADVSATPTIVVEPTNTRIASPATATRRLPTRTRRPFATNTAVWQPSSTPIWRPSSTPVWQPSPTWRPTHTPRPSYPTHTPPPPRPTNTRVAQGPLAFTYEIQWEVTPGVYDQVTAHVTIVATGGTGQYEYYRDGLPQTGATFSYQWAACRANPGSIRVESGNESVTEDYYEVPPCPATPSP